jgi:quercetin dioxygenase-like cupin family protein
MKPFIIIVAMTCIMLSQTTIAQNTIVRKPLLKVSTGTRTVTTVDIREITLAPAQKTGYHKHPCPVVGYIVSGTALIQVEGDSAKVVKAGEAFYEPAGMPMAHFDNTSTTEPLKFICYYLLNGDQELIQMLPPKSGSN